MLSVDVPKAGSIHCHTLWECGIPIQWDIQPSFLMSTNGYNQDGLIHRILLA